MKALGHTVHLRNCGWFWLGVPLGAMAAVLLVELPVLGLVVLFSLAALLLARSAARRLAFGLLTGAGIPLLLVAYLNRSGPGTTCFGTASAGGCDQHLNPIPWLLIGLALVLTGLIAQARQSS